MHILIGIRTVSGVQGLESRMLGHEISGMETRSYSFLGRSDSVISFIRDEQLSSWGKPVLFCGTWVCTSIQQEDVDMKMSVYPMDKECSNSNECLVVRNRKPRKCIRNPLNKKTQLFVAVVYAVSDRVMHFVFILFPGPYCFSTLLRTSEMENHLQVCLQINPLWSPGNALGKLSCCSRVLRSLNPWVSLGQSSLMKSQYLDGTVPRICKHAA